MRYKISSRLIKILNNLQKDHPCLSNLTIPQDKIQESLKENRNYPAPIKVKIFTNKIKIRMHVKKQGNMTHNEDKNQLIETGLLCNYVLYVQEGGGKSYGRCR